MYKKNQNFKTQMPDNLLVLVLTAAYTVAISATWLWFMSR